jgi:deoxycytidylate deaminase
VDKFHEEIEKLKKIANRSCLLHKHGACLMKGTKIISMGCNKYFKIWDFEGIKVKTTIHAEMETIANSYKKYVRGMDMMIIRIGSSNTLRNSRPCSSCIETMKRKGIRKVYYSTEEGLIQYEYIKEMQKGHISSGNLSIRRRRTSSVYEQKKKN